MLELEPRGFKYVVQVQLVENLGQGGRADLSCHWEDSDVVTQELYSNVCLSCYPHVVCDPHAAYFQGFNHMYLCRVCYTDSLDALMPCLALAKD